MATYTPPNGLFPAGMGKQKIDPITGLPITDTLYGMTNYSGVGKESPTPGYYSGVTSASPNAVSQYIGGPASEILQQKAKENKKTILKNKDTGVDMETELGSDTETSLNETGVNLGEDLTSAIGAGGKTGAGAAKGSVAGSAGAGGASGGAGSAAGIGLIVQAAALLADTEINRHVMQDELAQRSDQYRQATALNTQANNPLYQKGYNQFTPGMTAWNMAVDQTVMKACGGPFKRKKMGYGGSMDGRDKYEQGGHVVPANRAAGVAQMAYANSQPMQMVPGKSSSTSDGVTVPGNPDMMALVSPKEGVINDETYNLLSMTTGIPTDQLGALMYPDADATATSMINGMAKGGIYIKPENRGKFTAAAKRADMGVQQYASHVLADPNASPLLRKRANFARNAARWNRADGGPVVSPINAYDKDVRLEFYGGGKTDNYMNMGGMISSYDPSFIESMSRMQMANGGPTNNKTKIVPDQNGRGFTVSVKGEQGWVSLPQIYKSRNDARQFVKENKDDLWMETMPPPSQQEVPVTNTSAAEQPIQDLQQTETPLGATEPVVSRGPNGERIVFNRVSSNSNQIGVQPEPLQNEELKGAEDARLQNELIGNFFAKYQALVEQGKLSEATKYRKDTGARLLEQLPMREQADFFQDWVENTSSGKDARETALNFINSNPQYRDVVNQEIAYANAASNPPAGSDNVSATNPPVDSGANANPAAVNSGSATPAPGGGAPAPQPQAPVSGFNGPYEIPSGNIMSGPFMADDLKKENLKNDQLEKNYLDKLINLSTGVNVGLPLGMATYNVLNRRTPTPAPQMQEFAPIDLNVESMEAKMNADRARSLATALMNTRGQSPSATTATALYANDLQARREIASQIEQSENQESILNYNQATRVAEANRQNANIYRQQEAQAANQFRIGQGQAISQNISAAGQALGEGVSQKISQREREKQNKLYEDYFKTLGIKNSWLR